jgi:hypothetical protein
MCRLFASVLVVMCVTPATVYAQQTEPVHMSVSSASAAVHKSPSTGSPVVGTARRGASLDVTRELGDWVRVAWPDSPDGYGYVHRSMGRLVRGSTSPKTVTQVPTRPGAQPAPRGAGGSTPQRTPPQRPAPTATRATYVDPPTHFFGVGGLMTGSTFGYGVTGRAWSRNWLGAQVDMTRFSQSSAVTGDRVTTWQFAPSALYSFRDRVSDSVWVKPYVGGGASVRRHSLAAAATPELTVSETKFSFQTFGGGEFTLPAMPRFAFSVDAGYDWSETPYEGYDAGGFAFSLSGRWYFK